ncbi:flippase [Candidatus Woesearchaeota archaeon]|nr:flippase [Candidatus Woesearchaeota archaeon]
MKSEGQFYLKQIVKGIVISFIGLFFSKLFAYIYRATIARSGPAEYGLFSLGLAIFGIATAIGLLGFESGILQPIASYRSRNKSEEIGRVIRTTLIIGVVWSVVIAVILWLGAGVLGKWFHEQRLSAVVKIFAGAVPFYTVYRIFLSTFRAYKKITEESIIVIGIENLTRVIVTIIAVVLGVKIFGIVAIYAATIGIGAIVAYGAVKKMLHLKINKGLSQEETKGILFLSLPLMLSTIAGYVLGWTDTLMIGRFIDVEKVGIYNAALPTANLLNIASIAVLSIFIPLMTELWIKKDKKMMKEVYQRISKWVVLLNLPLMAVLLVFGRQFLTVFFGSQYSQAANALQWLSIGYFFFALSAVGSSMLNVVKRTKLIFWDTVVIGAINIILNYFFIQWWGFVGASVATMTSYFLLAAVSLYQADKYAKIESSAIIAKTMVRPLLAMMGAAAIVLSISFYLPISNGIIKIGVASSILLGVYLLLLIILKVFEKEDIEMIKLAFDKVKNKISGSVKNGV